jgi:hypothetical protein
MPGHIELMTIFLRILLLMFVCFFGTGLILSARMQQNYDPPCTTLDLRVPKYVVASREAIPLSADITGAMQILGEEKAKLLKYEWSVRGGTILTAQGSRTILVDASTSQQSGVHSISVRLQVKGLPPECASEVRRDIMVSADCAEPTKVDDYSGVSSEEERSRLDGLIERLDQSSPGSVLYIIVYSGRKACISEADLRANRIRKYLLETHKVSENQMIVFDGGFREKPKVELFISAIDACGPLPRSTLPMDKAQISGPCSEMKR